MTVDDWARRVARAIQNIVHIVSAGSRRPPSDGFCPTDPRPEVAGYQQMAPMMFFPKSRTTFPVHHNLKCSKVGGHRPPLQLNASCPPYPAACGGVLDSCPKNSPAEIP